MAETPLSLTPIPVSEIALGQPLPWPVYDAQGKLLLQRGFVVASASQLEGLVANGYFSDSRWQFSNERPAADKSKRIIHASRRRAEEPAAVAAAARETAVRMEDVRWHVGETLFMQVADNPKIRYSVPLLGFAKQQTIFVGAPMADGKLEFVREGQLFVVRAFVGKKAYAFTAAAVKSMLAPHPYLHLSLPKQVGCTVVRQDSRASVNIVASMLLDEEHAAAAILSDLSVSGCSALLKHPLGKPGQRGGIKFRVCAAGSEEYLDLKVILRSVMPASEEGGDLRHGLEFVEVSTRERLILSAFVHQTLVDHLA